MYQLKHLKLKRMVKPNVGEAMEELNHSYTAGVNENVTLIFENFDNLLKNSNHLLYYKAVLLLGI